MDIVKIIKNLCKPAYVYLIISLISTIILMIQNGGNDTKFCLGSFSCQIVSMSLFFIVQAIYTAIWVFILNWVCNSGYKNISWALVVFPYLLFFVALGVLVYNSKPRGKREGFSLGKKTPDNKDSDKSSDKSKKTLKGDDLKKAKATCEDDKINDMSDCIVKKYCFWDKDEGCILDKAYSDETSGSSNPGL